MACCHIGNVDGSSRDSVMHFLHCANTESVFAQLGVGRGFFCHRSMVNQDSAKLLFESSHLTNGSSHRVAVLSSLVPL